MEQIEGPEEGKCALRGSQQAKEERSLICELYRRSAEHSRGRKRLERREGLAWEGEPLVAFRVDGRDVLFFELHRLAAALELAVGERAFGLVCAALLALFDHLEFQSTVLAHIDLTQFHLVTACHICSPFNPVRGLLTATPARSRDGTVLGLAQSFLIIPQKDRDAISVS